MTTETPLRGADAVKAADEVIEELIADAVAGAQRAHLTKAPAGAGKTGAVVRLVGELAAQEATVGVAAQTNAQAFDIVKRIAVRFPKQQVAFMPGTDIELPDDTEAPPHGAT